MPFATAVGSIADNFVNFKPSEITLLTSSVCTNLGGGFMQFYDVYLRKCRDINMSPSKAAIDAGLTKTAVNRWKNGSMPSDATLLRLADYFGCPVSDFKQQTTTPATSEGDGGNEDSAMREEVNALFDSLDSADRARLLAFAQGLKLSQRPPEEGTR